MTIIRGGGSIEDPDLALLAAIAATLKADYIDPEADPWIGSPFAWIKTRPSRTVGKIGEQLVAGWAAAKGLDVVTTRDSDADRVINGRRTEIKFSTLWASGDYVFQQIRNQDYQQLVLLGLSPFSTSCWVVPKSAVIGTDVDLTGLTGQHTGSDAVDTLWLRLRASTPPKWMSAYGGTLAKAYVLLRA